MDSIFFFFFILFGKEFIIKINGREMLNDFEHLLAHKSVEE